MDAITLGKQNLQLGDLVVSTTDAPESTAGVLFALWGGLLLTSSPKSGPRPCRLSNRRRRGLQCVLIEDLYLDKSSDWELYRLTATEHLTGAEEQALEEIVKRMLRAELWHESRLTSVAAIALLLMRFGKLPRRQPGNYCVSSLVCELVSLMIYEHVPAVVEPEIIPLPIAA